jgi:hypothetical protein
MNNDNILIPIETYDGPVLDELLDLIENMPNNQNVIGLYKQKMKSQSKMINLKVGDVIKSRLCDETILMIVNPSNKQTPQKSPISPLIKSNKAK